MDKKTKLFFTVFLILIVFSATITFWRYVVKHDYERPESGDPTWFLPPPSE